MAEVLAEFPGHLIEEDGIVYRPQAAGAEMTNGRWEAWVEFVPIAGGTPVRTPRETTQPSRDDALYWASGLTGVYLEGALSRALRPLVERVSAPPQPVFDEPAPSIVRAVEVPVADAVLDPFEVYENGEAMLRKKLAALEVRHLVNIALAYDLSDEPLSTLETLSPSTLADIIVGGVRARSLRGSGTSPGSAGR